MRQNITLSLDKDLLQKARVLAARRQTSVSGMLREQLEKLVSSEEAYVSSKKRALADLNEGFHFGGVPRPAREKLHDREGLR